MSAGKPKSGARPPRKKKPMDPEVKQALSEIEQAWYAKGHKNLRGLIHKGREEKGIVAESTWYDWKNGAAADYAEVRRAARAVGLNVAPLALPDGTEAPPPRLSEQAAEVAAWIDEQPEEIRGALRDAIHRHLQLVIPSLVQRTQLRKAE